jgi:hypothetical protein
MTFFRPTGCGAVPRNSTIDEMESRYEFAGSESQGMDLQRVGIAGAVGRGRCELENARLKMRSRL